MKDGPMRRDHLRRFTALLLTLVLVCAVPVWNVFADSSDEYTEVADVSDMVLQEGAIPGAGQDADATNKADTADTAAKADTSDEETPELITRADRFALSPSYDEEGIHKALANASAKWNGESTIKVEVKQYGAPKGDAKRIYTSFMNTHGEFFYLSSTFKYGYNTSGMLTSITLYFRSESKVSQKKTFDKTVSSVMAQVDSSWSDVEKCLFLHDYLVTHCGYDEDENDYHYDAYSCLVDGSCVCQGYSLAFDYLCRLAGVESYVVTSSALCHAWNLVGADGRYYYIDCTYDDPMSGGKVMYPGYCKHDFFLISYNKMRNNKHYSSDWLIDSYDSATSYTTDTGFDGGMFWTSVIARIVPAGGHVWHFISSSSRNVIAYDFATETSTVYATLPTSYYYASMAAGNGDTFVSTGTNIYRISDGGEVTDFYQNSDPNGKIMGIDATTYSIRYYIYKDTTTYISQGEQFFGYHWVQKSGKWYYIDPDGKCVTGFSEIAGVTYYFDDKGAMITGWKQIGGKWYYFASSGAMKTGWFKVGTTWYYMRDDGCMVTGLLIDGDKLYYFNDSGAMKTGWQKPYDVWYYFASGGEAVTGWQKISKKWYYFDDNFVMQTGWVDIGSDRYFLKDDGTMATGWLKYEGEYYYLTSSGAMKTGWFKQSGKWYYLDEDGVMLASCSREIGGKVYDFNASGACTNP